MKIFQLIQIFVLVLIVCCSCTNQGKAKKNDVPDLYTAEIMFNDSIHDFGNISQRNSPYSHTFTLENIGNIPAVILHIIPSCRCTSITYGKKPIMVNGTDSLTVYFDTMESGKGYFDKTVKIKINSHKIYCVRIKGMVI